MKVLSQNSKHVLYVILRASVILIVDLRMLRHMPTSELCWKENSDAKWTRSSNPLITDHLLSQLS